MDLPAIRSDRHTVITLTNDHKQLTDTMANLLQQLHQSAREHNGNGAVVHGGDHHDNDDRHTATAVATTTTTFQQQQQPSSSLRPFAIVDAVSPDSPASQAGLFVGDAVLDFGGAMDMADLPSLVSANENIDMVVKVDRGGRMVEVVVKPRVWSGRGLLGCHLVPFVPL